MLKPLGDRVVLKIEEKEQTVGGFVLAGSAQEKTKTAQLWASTKNTVSSFKHLEQPVTVQGTNTLSSSYNLGCFCFFLS